MGHKKRHFTLKGCVRESPWPVFPRTCPGGEERRLEADALWPPLEVFPVSKTMRGTWGASVSMPCLRLAYHDDSSFESEAKVKSLQCWVAEGPKRRLTDSLPASSSTSMFLGALLPAAAPHADSRVGHFAAILIIHIITRLPGHTGHLQPGLLPRAQNCYSVPLSQPLKINLSLPQSPLTARPWCLSKVFLPHC